MPPAILAPPAPNLSLPTAIHTAASASLITLSVVVPVLTILAILLACLYLFRFRDRRTLPQPAPVATFESIKSPRRRETFVLPPLATPGPHSDPNPGAKLDTFAVHKRDAATPCALCQAPLARAMVTAARCGHIVHTTCLQNWLCGRPPVCPVCARDLRATRSRMHLDAPAESGDEGSDDGAHWGIADADADADAVSESDDDAGDDVVDDLARSYVRTNSEVALAAHIPERLSVWAAASTTGADTARFAKRNSACARAPPRAPSAVRFAAADVRRSLDAARARPLREPPGAATVEGGDGDEEVVSEGEADGFSDGWSEASGCVVREYVDEEEFGEDGQFSIVVDG